MIGKTISHYRILEKLGAGGMGVVYKAEDTKLKRTVALKFLPQQAAASEEEKARFEHEAQAAAALDHPNICTVYEINEAPMLDNSDTNKENRGQTFIAMAYVEGQSLQEIIGTNFTKPLRFSKVLDYATQIAEGLQAAHEKEIVHRDIKPANILITEKGQVRITDFGLAKLAGRTQLTKEGTSMGTVAYMSPEQTLGAKVDHRADIWAFGAVIYEMITARQPFAGDYEQAVIYSIMNEEPEPPTALRTGMPMELERIVLKALAKEPGERYQHVEEMLVDLKGLTRTEKQTMTGVRTHSSLKTKPAPLKKSSGTFLIAAAGTALILFALIAYFLQSGRKDAGSAGLKMIAVLPFENLGPAEDGYFADGITDEITSRLTSVIGLGVISRTSTLQYKNTDKNIKQIANELGVNHILEGTVRWAKNSNNTSRLKISPRLVRASDDVQIWANSYDRIIDDVFKIQSEIANEVIENMGLVLLADERRDVEAIPTQNMEAYQAYLRGLDYNSREPYSEEIRRLEIDMFQRAVDLDPNFALAYAALSLAHANLVNLGMDSTPERLALAEAAAERALALQSDLAEAHLALGYYYYWGFQDHKNALIALEEVKKIKPNHIELLKALAAIYRRQEGRTSDALDYMQRVVELNPRDATWVRELGNTYLHQGKFDQAITAYDHSIVLAPDQIAAYVVKALAYWSLPGGIKNGRAVLEAMPKRNDPLSNLVWTMQETRDRHYQAALARLSGIPVEIVELPDLLIPKTALQAAVYRLMGESRQARVHYEAALTILQKELKARPSDHRAHSALGMVYAGLGLKDNAIQSGKRGVELYPVSKDAFHGPTRLFEMAQIYTMVGKYDEALNLIEHLLEIPTPYSLHYVKNDPSFGALHDHPRFVRLLAKYEGRSG